MTPCILWKRRMAWNGYGQQTFRGKTWRAHRVSWVRAFGEIPKGMTVMHLCDVRGCINLHHLRLGTQAENLQDMRKKGRHSKPPVHHGETNSNTTITDAQVRTIREEQRDVPTRLLAQQYGVTRATINNILSGRTRSCQA